MADLKETCILMIHDDDICIIDTNVKSMMTTLKANGFNEIDDPRSKPYKRYMGKLNQISIKKAKRMHPTGAKTSSILASKKGS